MLFVQSGTRYAADAQVHASIMRHLPALGIDVHVAADPGTSADPSAAARVFGDIPGVRVVDARFGPRRLGARAVLVDGPAAVVSLVRLVRYARRHHVAVVHCTEKARESVMAYLVARLSGAVLVVHLHVKVADWFSRPTRTVMRRADRLLAISQFVAGSAVEQGYRPERIAVALNALAPHDAGAAPATDDRATIGREMELDVAAVVVCIVARINEWKGHDLLLRAFAIAIGRVPGAALLIVGQDDGRRASLEALAATLGISSHVRFTGFRSDAHRFIAACDIFAMPSVEEPFGLVFLEAMELGRPIVATDDGGTPEVVVDGVTGLLSAQGDVDALAEHLAQLAADATLRARMGAAGVLRVETEFQPERLAADVAAIYRAAIERSAAR